MENLNQTLAVSKTPRADAIQYGLMHAVGGTRAWEAGFRWPVAISSAVWDRCVRLPLPASGELRDSGLRLEERRLWDLVWSANEAVREAAPENSRLRFVVRCAQPDEVAIAKIEDVEVMIRAHNGDLDEPVLTITLPPGLDPVVDDGVDP